MTLRHRSLGSTLSKHHPRVVGLEDIADTAALLAGARRLLAAAYDATVALASAASTLHQAELLADGAAALRRPLTDVCS